MSITAAAATFSVFLAIYSGYPYINAVLKGRTRPHQLSWIVFTIMNGMVFFAQYLAGGRKSALISLAFFIYSFIIFILSFSKGTRNTSRADRALFAFALVAMITWAFTKNNVLAIWLTLLIDLAATAMIVLKEKKLPGSEDPTPWIIGTLAYFFSCITLIDVAPGILYVRPIYGLVCDGALVGFIFYYRTKKTRSTGIKISN